MSLLRCTNNEYLNLVYDSLLRIVSGLMLVNTKHFGDDCA